MQKIFTTKISLQSSNPTFSYPIIRLPIELKELAGRIANIYQTEIEGVEGFFIALQLDKLDKLGENADMCRKPYFCPPLPKKERPSRDLNPSRSLDSLRKADCFFKAREANIPAAEPTPGQETLATLTFSYTKEELDGFLSWRTAGLAHKSAVWIKKAAEVFWQHTKGTVSKDSLEQLRAFLFKKYDDYYAQSKVLNFTKGFLKYQAKLTLDPRYLAFDMFLEKPKVLKICKKMTARIVTKEDIERVLGVINEEMQKGSLDEAHGCQFIGIVLFGAFTGQRPYTYYRAAAGRTV